jgi:hypothetical protein
VRSAEGLVRDDSRVGVRFGDSSLGQVDLRTFALLERALSHEAFLANY